MAGPIDSLATFFEYATEGRTEIERDYREIFNAGSGNTINHIVRPSAGDYKYTNIPAKIPDLFDNVDVYADAAVTAVDYKTIQEVEVKVGYGSKPVKMARLALEWQGLSDAEAGTHWGTQAAVAKNFTMQKNVINALVGAMTNITSRVVNHQGTTANNANKLTLEMLLDATSKFGADYEAGLSGIIMHSKPFFDFQKNNLSANKELFDYPGLFRKADPRGIPIIVIDNPNLTYQHNSLTKYRTLFLTSNAATVFDDGNYFEHIDTSNGRTLIQSTIQAQGTYNIMIKGCAWASKTIKSPTLAQIGVNSNWTQLATDVKDTPGTLLLTQ